MTLWVKADTNLSRHRKTYKLADLLREGSSDLLRGQTFYAEWQGRALGFLLDFWAYAAEHHPSGDVTGAHVEALKEAVQRWVHGTEWSTKDPRELMVQCKFADRSRRGRIMLHDWYEWTGSDLLALVKDRKRQRLRRSRQKLAASEDGPRTRGGRERGKNPLEKKREEEKREEETISLQQKKTESAMYIVRCVIALNSGLRENPHIRNPREVPASTQAGLVTWEADGIPVEVAERVVHERAANYRPAGHNKQPSTLKYFDAAVREAHESRSGQDDTSDRPANDFDAFAQKVGGMRATGA